ncbi:MAG: hypothetical protein GXO47_07775 [Chlorobi bacterium]|nr:hypothetical protein [Chlorobiota bacterium]
MDILKEQTGCIISVLIIALPILILVKWFLRKELETKRIEYITGIKKDILPQRLQAYERLTLLLERLSPESLVLREQHQGMSSLRFHTHLLKVIRNEFDHNIAMQVYIPPKTWEHIERARTELLKLINSSAASVNPESSSLELGRTIIENSITEVNYYFKQALNALKKDVELMYK